MDQQECLHIFQEIFHSVMVTLRPCYTDHKGHALMADWSKVLPLTAYYLSPMTPSE